METELPDAVRRILDAVSEKLGRPAYCRQVKNREEWYIQDPVISFIQQGMKKGNTGYRVGYNYSAENSSLQFHVVHSPIISKLFKRNLNFSTLIEVLRDTEQFRTEHFIFWDSRHCVRSGFDDLFLMVNYDKLDDLIDHLHRWDNSVGFVDDLFPGKPNTGKGTGKAPVAGNTFYVKIADKRGAFRTRATTKEVIERSWPLFLCLYPVEPIERRTAALARNMKAKRIPQVCEFEQIQGTERSGISKLCRGAIQGAHIKPDALGGSDRPENGLWLCEYHHRETEGKIKGTRTLESISVQYHNSV